MMVRRFHVLGLLLAFILSMGLMGCETTISDKDVDKNQVSVAEVKRLIAEAEKRNKDDVVVLIDPRPKTEFAKGHIPGARNLSLSAVKPNAPLDRNLDNFKNIVVYGNDPSSASPRAMVKRLMGNGYSNVTLLAGGFFQWQATGGAVEVSTDPTPVPQE